MVLFLAAQCAQSVHKVCRKDKCAQFESRVHNKNDSTPCMHKMYQNVSGDHNICFSVNTLVLSASWLARIAGAAAAPLPVLPSLADSVAQTGVHQPTTAL
jgi:hypothetical protein